MHRRLAAPTPRRPPERPRPPGRAQGAVGHGDRNWTYEFDPTKTGTRLADYGSEQ